MSATIDSSPISNFETNPSSFRRSSPTRGAGEPHGRVPEERLRRRVLDIEDVLIWAFRDELPKGRAGTGGGEPSRVCPMFSMVAFGSRIDNWSREPGFPLACGEPHPDALIVEAAVDGLARFAGQAIEGDLGLVPTALGADEVQSMRKALQAAAAIVVRCAKLQNRPYWTSTIKPAAITEANGKPIVMRWEPDPEQAGSEILAPIEVRKKGVYPTGSHCPCSFPPRLNASPTSGLNMRCGGPPSRCWRRTCRASSAASRCSSPQRRSDPGRTVRSAPNRPASSRTSLPRVYRTQARQTADAYRMLGQRRRASARSPLPSHLVPRRTMVRHAA